MSIGILNQQSVNAEFSLAIVVNRVAVTFFNTKPFIDKNSKVQVPIAFVSENLGCKVNWKGKGENVATIVKGKDTISLNIGSKQINRNGKLQNIDGEVTLKDGTLYVPIISLCQTLGVDVKWEARTLTVFIDTTKKVVVTAKPTPKPINKKLTKYYSGISFNPQRDIVPDGRMSVAKEQEFYMAWLKQLKFYKQGTKYYVKCTYPQLPAGFDFDMNIEIEKKGGDIIILKTDAYLKQQNIPKKGSLVKELNGIGNLKNINWFTATVSIKALKYTNKNEEPCMAYLLLASNNMNRIALVYKTGTYDTQYIEYNLKQVFRW
jgi:hypothetical protein